MLWYMHCVYREINHNKFYSVENLSLINVFVETKYNLKSQTLEF